MKNLSISEKVALIWSIPLTATLIFLAFIYSTVKYLLQAVFVYSGTAGSMSFLFIKIKQSSIRKIWKQIEEQDSLIKNFDGRN
jgi:hypothetical protein